MFSIAIITTNAKGISVFGEKQFDKTERNGMWLSNQIEAKNFRLRESQVCYNTDFHSAGDATLIIIQKGILRITLQDGSFKNFNAGDMFIAADHLPEGFVFDKMVHGHKAEVIGQQILLAVHIKLTNFSGNIYEN